MRKRQRPPSTLVETLEPRLLMSADPLGAAIADALGQIAQPDDDRLNTDTVSHLLSEVSGRTLPADTLAPLPLELFATSASTETGADPDADALAHLADNTSAIRQEVVFVDSRTPDIQTLMDGLQAADATRQLTVFVLDAETDGIEQISNVLSGFTGLDAVHLISHGGSDGIQLGSAHLDTESLAQQQPRISSWAAALGGDADLLIYGCDLAATNDGRALAEQLARTTGADVAASEDLTGQAALGGDWDLEFKVGQIESAVALDIQAQADWSGVLAAPVADGGETLVNTTTTGTQEAPDVAAYENGDYVAVWSSSSDIFFRRFEADGTPKDATQVAAHTSTLLIAESNPSVAVSEGGNFVVTWQTSFGTGDNIAAAVF